jgi:phospholipase A1/A2
MQRCSISFATRQSRCFAAGMLFLALSAQAADPDPLSQCTAISDREQRWRCYDEVTSAASSRNSNDNPAEDTCGAGYTTLSRQWNTRPNCGSKLYSLSPYRQNYLIFRSSNSPNNHPTSAVFRQPVGDQHLEEQELKFQLSIKVKVAEQIGNIADLWFGYSQQSNWQAFNNANIRPFRNTDYEPELILGFPLSAQASALGFTPRLINLGLVHQSNGQRDPFERSWNRVYAQIGLDRDVDKARDRFAVLARAWYRLPETPAQDVNPDIQHYLGYGDLVFFWRHGDSNVSALLRNNLQTQNNRGSLQLNWSIPVTRVPSLDNVNVQPHIDHELRFYVQFFNGFGETLLDYNHYQTTIGIGLMLTDWL